MRAGPFRRRAAWVLAGVGMVVLVALAASTARSRGLLLNTLWLAGLTAALSLPWGTAIAWWLTRTRLRVARLAGLCLVSMVLLPPYLQVAAWDAGFGLQGWFTRALGTEMTTALLSGWRGAVWVHTTIAIPWVVLILGLGFRSRRVELEQAALLDAGPWQVFWHISLPAARPALLIATLWVLVSTATDITVTDVYQIRTFAEEVYTGFALGEQLSAVQRRSWPAAAITACLVAAGLALSANVMAYGRQGRAISDWRFPPHHGRWMIRAVTIATVLVLIGIPLGNLLYQAGMQVSQQGDERVRRWAAGKALRLILSSPWAFREEIAWSLLLGQASALAAVGLAFPLAWHARSSRRTAALGTLMTAAGLAIPGPVLALTLNRLWNRPGWDLLLYLYDHSILLPWLAILIRIFPLAYIIAHVAVRRIDARLLQAAAIDGAGPIRRFCTIGLPQLSGPITCGWLVTFALAVADVSASILAVPPGVTTLAIRIFNLIHYGVQDQLAALCLSLIGGFIALVAFGVWLLDARPAENE